MATFPTRGQKAPDYWDDDLKAYIDEYGVASITRTTGDGSPGTTDTYTVAYVDGHSSTFSIHNGINGTSGSDGEDGAGVPAGGATAAVLRKASGSDFATEWHALVKADVGLGNVDNTADEDKIVSGPQQTALDGKVSGSGNIATDWGVQPRIYYDAVDGWPDTRVVPAGYSGPAEWVSWGFPDVVAPPTGVALEDDIWWYETS